MPIGEGKYDRECEAILRLERAGLVLVIVIGGRRGGGFSLAALDNPEHLGLIPQVPGMLRQIADKVEEDLRKSKGN